MPYKYVKEVLLSKLIERDTKALAKLADVNESSIVNIIEGKEIARHSTLIKIVDGLEGRQKRDEFILENREYSPTFRVASLFAELSKPNMVSFRARDTIDPRIYEILIYTGCGCGFDKEKLVEILPRRKDLIESLISKGIIIEDENGRLFSSIENENDPYLLSLIIKNKIEIKMSQSRDELFGPYNISARENSLDARGTALAMQGISVFNEFLRKVAEKHSVKDGTIFSINICGFSFNVEESERKEITLEREKVFKIDSLEDLL